MKLTKEIIDELCEQGKKVEQYHTTCHRGDITLYYGFLKKLAEYMQPKLVVEFGTWQGQSSMYLADGCPESKVVSLDNLSICDERKMEKKSNLLDQYKRDNVDYFFMDAMQWFPIIKKEPIDILFIDGYHDYNALAEFEHFLPFMANESIILMDDLNMTQGLKNAWQELKAKYTDFEFVERHDLHSWQHKGENIGFGYVIVRKFAQGGIVDKPTLSMIGEGLDHMHPIHAKSGTSDEIVINTTQADIDEVIAKIDGDIKVSISNSKEEA